MNFQSIIKPENELEEIINQKVFKPHEYPTIIKIIGIFILVKVC